MYLIGIRLFAFLNADHEVSHHVQFEGLPEELSGSKYSRSELPRPQLLIIEEQDDGIFLYRFTMDGGFGGDTWHATMEDAKHQASYEYGEAVGEWRVIPPEAKDSLEYARSRMT